MFFIRRADVTIARGTVPNVIPIYSDERCCNVWIT